VHLASISGGTDIVSCFVLGNPALPVWRGEIQGPGLGMAVEVWDDDGKPSPGKRANWSAPSRFRPCRSASGTTRRREIPRRLFLPLRQHLDPWRLRRMDAPRHGIIIHGRSDATLNPGGVRIGTAEIYNQVEQMDEVVEAICIGQDWDDDVRVVLFVRLAEGVALDDDLKARIRAKIRTGASPRHVPAKIIAVTDIPAHQVRQDR
jgi:acetoacetyl-CoA synthetase